MDIYLTDGTYELFRHYYALPSARDSDGLEVAAARGVLASVLGHGEGRKFSKNRAATIIHAHRFPSDRIFIRAGAGVSGKRHCNFPWRGWILELLDRGGRFT